MCTLPNHAVMARKEDLIKALEVLSHVSNDVAAAELALLRTFLVHTTLATIVSHL